MKREEQFDFASFEQEAIEKLKEGKPLSGVYGVFTPLIKRKLEASLEGELDSHLEENDESNRRNSKLSIGNVEIKLNTMI